MKNKISPFIKKTRTDNKINRLSEAARAQLCGWLFEDKVGVKEAWLRAQDEFGFDGSLSCVQRFSQETMQQEWLEQLAWDAESAEGVTANATVLDKLRSAGLKLAGQKFFQQMMANDNRAEAGALAQILIAQEANELERERNDLRRQELEFKESRQRFQVTKWQFKLAEEVERDLPMFVREYKAYQDAQDPYSENKRINAIRKGLFGDCAKDLAPENDEEMAVQEAKKKAVFEEQERRSAAMMEQWKKETEAAEKNVSEQKNEKSEKVR